MLRAHAASLLRAGGATTLNAPAIDRSAFPGKPKSVLIGKKHNRP
jgi:hypothetical protein